MAVTRVEIGGGEVRSQEMPSTKQHASSTDYQGGGVEVRQGPLGMKTQVHDPSSLNPNDLIVIGGSEMKVSMAKELGLLNQVFDENLSVGAAAKAAQDNTEAPQGDTSGKTGVATFDDAVDGLNASLEAEIMSLDEAREYETPLAQIAQAGLSYDDAIETIEGLASGEIASNDVPGETQAMLKQAEETITKAATASAQAELGGDFEWLQNAAATHQGVNRVVRQYAIDRSTGKAGDVTWSDLVGTIKEQLGQ